MVSYRLFSGVGFQPVAGWGSTCQVLSSAVPSGSGAFQMPTRPSSAWSAVSTFKGGKAQSQKRFSNFFSFWHEASLG